MISDPKTIETLDGTGPTVISFWHTYNDEETRLLEQELIPAFEREHTDIQVDSINLAINNELRNTLIARASSNRGPDVVRLDQSWIPEFSHNGLLEPINGYPGYENIQDQFHKEALQVSFDHKQCYSLPLDIYVKLAIYNRELLNRAGYSEPPRTMKEVIELAREHRYSIGLGGWGPWFTLPYIFSLGGAFMDGNFSKASGFLNSEATVQAVKQLTALYEEKLINFSTLKDNIDNWSRVKTGNLLMTDEGPWFYSLLNDTELDQATQQTLPVPFPRGNGTASIMGGNHLVIMKGSKHPAEAWTFMKWMTGKDAQLVMAQTGLIPTNLEARKSWTVNRESFLYPYVEATNIRQIFLGEWSVQEGLDRAAAEIDKLLVES